MKKMTTDKMTWKQGATGIRKAIGRNHVEATADSADLYDEGWEVGSSVLPSSEMSSIVQEEPPQGRYLE